MAVLTNGELHEADGYMSMPPQSIAIDRGIGVAGGRTATMAHAAPGTSLDELAVAMNMEPLQFLLSTLAGPRASGPHAWSGHSGPEFDPADPGRTRNVVLLAAARSGWRSPLPDRQGRGIAAHLSPCAHMAAVARVAVTTDDRVSVSRVDLAVDCGTVLDAERLVAALRRAAASAVVTALDGRLSNGAGGVLWLAEEQEAPDIRVHILRSEATSGDTDEAGIPVTAAIINAVSAATGLRPRARRMGGKALNFH